MNSASDYLFVYGTLRLGVENDVSRVLHRSSDLVSRARARGRLYMIEDYPGFVCSDAAGDWVWGDVFRLHAPELLYPELDRYEGCRPEDPKPHEYRRSVVPVLTVSGAWMQASVYIYVLDTSVKLRIRPSDYLVYRTSRVPG